MIYENGIDTRKAILTACTTLFLEKGYRSTSMDNICQAAHVNRGSIYYHFKDKENIRYEVHWTQFMHYLSYVRDYCNAPEYEFSLAVYVLWHHLCTDPKIRRFYLDYFKDYPAYSPKENLSLSVKMMTDQMYRHLLSDYAPDKLALSFVYGFLMSVVVLTDHADIPPAQLFYRVFESGNLIRGVPLSEINEAWDKLHPYLMCLPIWEEPNSFHL